MTSTAEKDVTTKKSAPGHKTPHKELLSILSQPCTRAKGPAQKVMCLLGKEVSPNRGDIQPRLSTFQGGHRPAQDKVSTRQGPLVEPRT
ncbi:hypothetical protein CHS0354_004800 [Potamilus streckersoni]|uniref:Uncharacterized protein n=1 Tax=Potamilus streckersoni TaxID=2493646 RepID=A0AAE0VSL6_9BIVA|nr:hypothetical protein CHS0354_004800 [Potamilus streckersoni]